MLDPSPNRPPLISTETISLGFNTNTTIIVKAQKTGKKSPRSTQNLKKTQSKNNVPSLLATSPSSARVCKHLFSFYLF